jgi:cell division protein FtsQ
VRLALLVTLAASVVLLGGWLWLRDSSLVAVDQITITGENGADAPAIQAALRLAARQMTTLDVQTGRLRAAVSSFPEVKALRVSTQFPHRLVIRVIEQRPVAAIQMGGSEVVVASDGTILRDTPVNPSLPQIQVGSAPMGRRLTEPAAISAVAVLATAPYRLLGHISQVTTVAGHGLVAQLRGGPSVYFGDASALGQKWLALTEVLGDSSSTGATYIDVTDPAHPAAGAGAAAGAGSSTGAPATASGPSASPTSASAAGAPAGSTTTGGG